MPDELEWLAELRRKYHHLRHDGSLGPFDAAEIACIIEGAEGTVRELKEAKRQLGWFKAAHWLLANDEAFIAPPGGTPFFVMAEVSEQGECGLSLNMNDTFAFACADAEDFLYSDAPELMRIAKEDGWPGLVRWASEKRGERPIKPIVEMMETHYSALEKAKEELEALRPLRAKVERLRARLGRALVASGKTAHPVAVEIAEILTANDNGHCTPDGTPGVRDGGAPCKEYRPGEPGRHAACQGDGHYLCAECTERDAGTLAEEKNDG